MNGGVFATSNAIGIGTRRNGKWIILFSSPISPIHERQQENECSHEPSTIIIPPHDDCKQWRESGMLHDEVTGISFSDAF